MESFCQPKTTMQYAYLQPLKIFDDDDEREGHQEPDVNDGSCNEGPALTPIKEELVAKDLYSYFRGKGKLFDEPDSLPIIWVDVPTKDDFTAKKNSPKHTKPKTRPSSRKKHHRRGRGCPTKSKEKNNKQRTIPCRNCERKFITVAHMEIHAMTHLRKRKNTCFVCGRKFNHGGALCLHMRIHNISLCSRN